MFIGCHDGHLFEYLVNEKATRYFGQVLNSPVTSMSKTPDNKCLFVCDHNGNFAEYDIATNQKKNNYQISNARVCVVTWDGKFLVTAEKGYYAKLSKWSIESKQQVHSWNSKFNSWISS